MKIPELGSAVSYHRAEGSGDKRKYVAIPAMVIGREISAAYDLDKDGLPSLALAFVEPSRVSQLLGSLWRDAIDRSLSVPHEDVNSSGNHFYSI